MFSPTKTTSYTLKFSTPGSYRYVCVIHDEFGMVATITVAAGAAVAGAPAQIPAQMPNTGGGPPPLFGDLALLGLLLVALGGGRLVAGRTR